MRFIDLVKKMSYREKPDYKFIYYNYYLDIFSNYLGEFLYSNQLNIDLIGMKKTIMKKSQDLHHLKNSNRLKF